MRFEPASKREHLDIGVLRIGGDRIVWGSEQRDCCDLDVIRQYIDAAPREQLYLVAGFPESRTRATEFPEKRLDASLFGLVGEAVAHPKYDPTDFVVLEVVEKKKRTFVGETTQRRFPNPVGMSGSPVFALHYDDAWHPHAIVVAVVIERDEKKRHLVCSRIKPAVEMIDLLLKEIDQKVGGGA